MWKCTTSFFARRASLANDRSVVNRSATDDGLVVHGGTGIAPRDTTFEAVQGLLEKEISGFGELFRMLSYQDIGSAAIMSRAVAGSAQGKVLISLPGSKGAVGLAMEKLILPELRHMVSQLHGT